MKTYKNLIHNNITLEKCKSIIVRAAKHKHKRNSVKKVLENIDYYALKLYEMVLRDKYDFKPTHTFKINEYGKERTITSAPFFPNQCIDYLMLECGFRDIILSKCHFQQFGNVIGKGGFKGKKHIERHLPKYRYFLKFDIKKYYENIDKTILLNQIKRIVSDKKFIYLITQMLENQKDKGLTIGSIASQYLALFYIKDFVGWLNHKCKLLVNYVDDFLVVGNNKRHLKYLINEISIYLSSLNLKLNKKTIIYGINQRFISMLGFRFKKKLTILRKKILNHIYTTKNLICYKGWVFSSNCYKIKLRLYYNKGA